MIGDCVYELSTNRTVCSRMEILEELAFREEEALAR
jgi:hypothetical protein